MKKNYVTPVLECDVFAADTMIASSACAEDAAMGNYCTGDKYSGSHPCYKVMGQGTQYATVEAAGTGAVCEDCLFGGC